MPETRFKDQFLAEGYLPIVTTRWLQGDLLYEQEAVAVPLAWTVACWPESVRPLEATVRL